MLTKTQANFKLKGSIFTLTVLQLLNTDLTQLNVALAEKIQQAPKFFHSAPVVIDLKKVTEEFVDFSALRSVLKNNQLIPVGVRGGSKETMEQAQLAGFAIMLDHNRPAKETETTIDPTQEEPKQVQTISRPGSRMITTPIRSGQQIYAQGDLIVIASVSPGAEILAEGNIHVYGSLKGRALAGVNGDTSARIFCKKLQAELISIAGNYQIFEDFQDHYDNSPKQVYLKDDKLLVDSL